MNLPRIHQSIRTLSRLERAAAMVIHSDEMGLQVPPGAANVVAVDKDGWNFQRVLAAVEALERQWRRTQAERVFRCN